MVCGILVPQPGVKPTPLHRQHRVLTTEPPEKSPYKSLLLFIGSPPNSSCTHSKCPEYLLCVRYRPRPFGVDKVEPGMASPWPWEIPYGGVRTWTQAGYELLGFFLFYIEYSWFTMLVVMNFILKGFSEFIGSSSPILQLKMLLPYLLGVRQYSKDFNTVK